jgi:hypothetical protein
MDLGGATLLVLRTGLQGHGSQQECRCGQGHRGLSHQSLLFQGCRIEGNARQRADDPPPLTVEELDACFVVRDANGQALAYVYYEDEPGRRSAAKLLSKDEARRIAASIAKLVVVWNSRRARPVAASFATSATAPSSKCSRMASIAIQGSKGINFGYAVGCRDAVGRRAV